MNFVCSKYPFMVRNEAITDTAKSGWDVERKLKCGASKNKKRSFTKANDP
jgi:hypothetical protein